MHRFTFLVFALCISCIYSAPSSLISALLPLASSSSSSSSSSNSDEAIEMPFSSSATHEHKQREPGYIAYDQKQTGKYNIHLNIKDVSIIALDAGRSGGGANDWGDDYYIDYDLADFTVKPGIGLLEIPTGKPSTTSTTKAPSLIHDEEGEEDVEDELSPSPSPALPAPASGNPENINDIISLFLAHSANEEPIIKDPPTVVKEPASSASIAPNKTQSVVILNQSTTSAPSVTVLGHNESSNGIVVTTPTPSPESLPPKLSIADIANLSTIQVALKPSPAHNVSQQQPSKPNEIPVQIILEQIPATRQRHRPNNHGNWRLKNRIRATQPSNNRRITPPRFETDDTNASSTELPAAKGHYKLRRNAMNGENRKRNCARDRSGKCHNHSRRFGSPLVGGLMKLLTLLTPGEMEKLE